ARGIETRREAVGAAVIGALLCIIPGFLFHLTFLARYPEILTEEVPLYTNIAATGLSVRMVAYLIELIVTVIETGASRTQGVNAGIEAVLAERKGGAEPLGSGPDRGRRDRAQRRPRHARDHHPDRAGLRHDLVGPLRGLRGPAPHGRRLPDRPCRRGPPGRR